MIYYRFLDEVQSHANENKMSVQNLATVFGPNILRAKMEDPVSMMEGKAKQCFDHLCCGVCQNGVARIIQM